MDWLSKYLMLMIRITRSNRQNTLSIKHLIALGLILFFHESCTKANEGQLSNPSKGKILKEITVNGTTREYIVYVPQNYTENTPVPLLLSFHGLTSNMEFNYAYTKFNELAERENFIVVYPNGISNRWVITNGNNSDIGFVNAVLDTLEEKYNIESSRIYSTGMSMGGFFSFNLACELTERIAAIASVTGSMYQLGLNSCFPSKPIPIIQIHGTEDNIVNYSTVPSLLDFWTSHNRTDTRPITISLPNTDTQDGSTVKQYDYLNGQNGVEVRHLQIIGGGHDWPGYRGNMDINASEEVWRFVKNFNINGKSN